MSRISLPSNPSINDEFFAAGKLLVWTGSSWVRSTKYVIIDAGFSGTEVTAEVLTADGGDA